MTSIEFPTDLYAPGAVDALFAARRAMFGDAVMMADTNDDDAGTDGDANGQDTSEPDTEETGDGDEELRDSGKRALQAERRRAREAEKSRREALERAEKAEQALEERRRAEMSEVERLAAERDDYKKRLDQQEADLAAREVELMRREVAVSKGLPPEAARRLSGQTREEIEEDADELLSLIPSKQEQTRTPRPDPTAGRSGGQGKPRSMAAEQEDYLAKRLKELGVKQ